MVGNDPRPALSAARLSNLGVFVLDAFWDEAACARVRAAMDRGRATPAEIYVDGYVVDEDVRLTLDLEVDSATVREVERTFADVRSEVSKFFGDALSRAEGPGFLRYPTGGFYRAHRDRLDDPGEEFSRRISLVLFLTDANRGAGDGRCKGGSLRLYGVVDPGREMASLEISPATGTLVAFRSDVLHEVLPVTDGVRDVIVDWFY
jgi:predicted 2-oxoglutarate/Fe(II)-dependent dioxygenase YbiX